MPAASAEIQRLKLSAHRRSDPGSGIIIEAVVPAVDDGRFPVKREAGDSLVVSADIYKDGHEILAASLLYRHAAAGSARAAWRRVPMSPLGNDRWRGEFPLDRVGAYAFAVEAWVEVFESWRRDALRKRQAGQSIASDLIEGADLLRRLRPARGAAAAAHKELLARISAADPSAAAELLLAENAAALARSCPPLSAPVRSEREYPVCCERVRARFGAWYEMFPRSQGREPGRSATFREAEARLPAIQAMGFDVLYLPPIHPIGHTHRKGPNNSLRAAPGDPGSVYAVGSEAGGHDAVEPSLGTLADFDRFREAAAAHGLEIALDLALNCSPDHPWVREHPEWFFHRPDGSIKYAENPPKRYEDIFPLNFHCADWKALWREIERIVEVWIGHGVRIFRVDNPHTKPFAFWQWLIAAVRARHPDAIFLSEAFTRPKVMHYLAKLGFSQSYTYFTWRNTKAELTDYLQELAHGPGREYFRPNFFANTPDILSEILQRGGRPAFLQRLVLAATLSPSYGIYSGFELCENRAVPGTEEYADSEKYQFKVWDWDRPGNIKQEIARINDIRRRHPALARLDGLRFMPADNDQVLFYARQSPAAADLLLIAVNLDPFHPQSAFVELPLEELGLGPDESFEIDDLLGGYRGRWQGRRQWVRLDPAVYPAHVFQVRRQL